MSSYDDALNHLYRAPFGEFVAERKRLSGELKASGDKDGAARLGKLARPPVSAWAVNQLWWAEQKAFEAFIDAAARVKVGDREASKLHKDALARLREHAAQLLQEAGNAATEPTLRRVTTTLSAVAASGGFAPDPPGALSSDRDPPGFEALGFASVPSAVAESKATSKTPAAETAAEDAAAKRAEEAAKRRLEEEQRKARVAERERLSASLREAQKLRTTQQRELSRLRDELDTAEQDLKKTQALLAELEEKLERLSG